MPRKVLLLLVRFGRGLRDSCGDLVLWHVLAYREDFLNERRIISVAGEPPKLDIEHICRTLALHSGVFVAGSVSLQLLATHATLDTRDLMVVVQSAD